MSFLLNRLQKETRGLPVLLLGELISRRKLAQDFISWKLCSNNDKYNFACGNCNSCNIAAIEHPDVLSILTENNSSILIESSREVISFLNTLARFTLNKIVWIDDMENLNVYAATGLLKTLEDSDALFILGAHNAQVLPKTLLSRCLRFHLNDVVASINDKEFFYVMEQIVNYLNQDITLNGAIVNLSRLSVNLIYNNIWLIVLFSLKGTQSLADNRWHNFEILVQKSTKVTLWAIINEVNKYLLEDRSGIKLDLELGLEYILLLWKEGWQKKLLS